MTARAKRRTVPKVRGNGKRSALAIEQVATGQLKPAPYNPRTMTDGARKRLEHLIREHGLVDPIIARRKDRLVVGGHQRLVAAKKLGLATVPVVFLDLSDAQAKALNVALNNPAAQGAWDEAALSSLLAELDTAGFDLTLTGFDEKELAELMGSDIPAGQEAPDVDLTPPAKPKSKRGEVYELGRHRLMCGDATVEADRLLLLGAKKMDLVFTDPPYAIYGSSTGVASDIMDDKMVRPFFRDIITASAAALKSFGHIYVCCDWRSWSSWWEVSKGTGIVPKNMIVWDKGGGLGTNYANAHELLFFGSYLPIRQNMTQKMSGMRAVHALNIWRFNREKSAGQVGGREHNAQKPVDLVTTAIEHSTDEGQSVCDFFGGSGTTLIAAEQTGRRAFLMEIDERYCDVTRRRYAELVGKPEFAP